MERQSEKFFLIPEAQGWYIVAKFYVINDHTVFSLQTFRGQGLPLGIIWDSGHI
jgi:hypothetical protein